MQVQHFLTSSLGKKIVMALTGLFLITFLIVHCGVNALIFYNDGGIKFEEAAHFMGTNPVIRTMEIVLFLGLILHVYQAWVLTQKNNNARSVKYAVNDSSANSKWYTRSMGLLGTLLLIFLILHLKHFWVVSRFTDHITSGEETLYMEMKEIFEHLWIVIVYVLSMVSLGYHLLHGFYSAFQTLGLNNKKYTPIIKQIGLVFSIVVPAVFALMPIAMHFNWV